jgi:hypothetical protein
VLEVFTRHPRAVGESYREHIATAWSFGILLVGAGLACLVHGLLPFAFEHSASRCIATLHDRMRRRVPGAVRSGQAVDTAR